MRQLKTFMRNRKKEMLACGPCECRTLQCWRYANENCGCGEGGGSSDIAIDGISLPSSISITEGLGNAYYAEYSPENATNPQSQISFGRENDGYANCYIASFFPENHSFDLVVQGITVGQDNLIVYINGDEYTRIPVEVTPWVHVESITVPSESDISLEVYTESHVAFSYAPSSVTRLADDVTVSSSNENIATAYIEDYGEGMGEVVIYGVDQGPCTVSYTDGRDTYSIAVTVTPGL